MTWHIYALRHPDTLEVRYIGLSADPRDRLHSHLSEHASAKVRSWVASLGQSPDLAILESTDVEADARLKEQIWIARFPFEQLLNTTSGGELRPGKHPVKFTGAADRLRRLRESKHISQSALGRLADVGKQTIARIENGSYQNYTANTAVLLARALGTTVEYLVTGESP